MRYDILNLKECDTWICFNNSFINQNPIVSIPSLYFRVTGVEHTMVNAKSTR
jgi:hypothetical protein